MPVRSYSSPSVRQKNTGNGELPFEVDAEGCVARLVLQENVKAGDSQAAIDANSS
jgi:hypothetical protein